MNTIHAFRLLSLMTFVACANSLLAQGTAFTYQGRLNDGANAASGLFDLKFAICDSSSGPNMLATANVPAVPVTNGLFTVTLDFGNSAFNGAPRWLEIGVRSNGTATDFATLAPRQALTPSPYSIFAGSATDAKHLDGQGTNAFAPAIGSANYVAKSGDMMTGTLTLPANGLVAGGNQLFLDGVGQVGIGTTTPHNRLHVSGNGTLLAVGDIANIDSAMTFSHPRAWVGYAANDVNGLLLESGAGKSIMFGVNGTDFNSGQYNAMAITSSGNVGIGTTGPAGKLHINAGTVSPGLRIVTDNGGPWGLIMRNLASGNAGFQMYQGNDGKTHMYSPYPNHGITLDTVGNVGIGTVNPNTKLQVIGPDAVGGTGGWKSEFISGYAANYPSQRVGFGYDASGFTFGAALMTEGTTRLWAGHDGNVGIGTTSPEQLLHLKGRLARIKLESTSAGTANWSILPDYSPPGLSISEESSAHLFIQNGGNVGIGTTSPQRRLHVAGATSEVLIGESVNAGLSMAYDGSGTTTTYVDSRYDDASAVMNFRMRANGTPVNALTIFGTGNVGIGTVSPQAKLEVAGNLKVSGPGNSISTPVLSITGGADVAEPFPMSMEDIPKGAVVIIDDAHPGQLKLSDQPYDSRVAGIVSGAGGVNPGLTLSQEGALAGGHNVALSGRVYAQADATTAPIKPGDLLTTSATPGHCMKATDRDRAPGAILGKAMSSLKEGKGLLLVLVSLQ